MHLDPGHAIIHLGQALEDLFRAGQHAALRRVFKLRLDEGNPDPVLKLGNLSAQEVLDIASPTAHARLDFIQAVRKTTLALEHVNKATVSIPGYPYKGQTFSIILRFDYPNLASSSFILEGPVNRQDNDKPLFFERQLRVVRAQVETAAFGAGTWEGPLHTWRIETQKNRGRCPPPRFVRAPSAEEALQADRWWSWQWTSIRGPVLDQASRSAHLETRAD